MRRTTCSSQDAKSTPERSWPWLPTARAQGLLRRRVIRPGSRAWGEGWLRFWWSHTGVCSYAFKLDGRTHHLVNIQPLPNNVPSSCGHSRRCPLLHGNGIRSIFTIDKLTGHNERFSETTVLHVAISTPETGRRSCGVVLAGWGHTQIDR